MAKDRKTLKAKKKKWFNILAPKEFNNEVIGETPSFDPRLLEGKVVSANLMSITKNIKKQNINMKFRIKGVSDNKAQTDVIGFQLLPTFIKRIIRRGRNNLHNSFVCMTSDKIPVRMKILVITVNKANGAVANALNVAAKENLIEYVSKLEFSRLVSELTSYILQSNLKASLKKIYPVKNFEVKEMLIETKRKSLKKALKESEERQARPEKKGTEDDGERPKKKDAKPKQKDEEEVKG